MSSSIRCRACRWFAAAACFFAEALSGLRMSAPILRRLGAGSASSCGYSIRKGCPLHTFLRVSCSWMTFCDVSRTLMRRLAHDWQRVNLLRWSSGPTIRRAFIWCADLYDWLVSRIIMSSNSCQEIQDWWTRNFVSRLSIYSAPPDLSRCGSIWTHWSHDHHKMQPITFLCCHRLIWGKQCSMLKKAWQVTLMAAITNSILVVLKVCFKQRLFKGSGYTDSMKVLWLSIPYWELF